MGDRESAFALACGGLLAMAAAIGIGRFVYTPILPVMIDDLAWSKSEAGLVASANFLGYLIGALVAVRPIAPENQRRGLLVSLLVSALTTLGMGFQSHFGALLVLRLLGGAASAFVIVLASTLVLTRLPTARRAELSAVHFAGVGVGIIISSATVSGLITAGGSWQLMWIWSGTIAFLATLLIAALIPRTTAIATAPAASAEAPPASGLVALILAYGLFGFGYVITATFLVTTVRMTAELRALETWIWVLFGFAAVPSVAFWSWVGTRLGLMRAYALASVVEALGVAASVEWLTIPGACLAAALLGGTFMGLTALGLVAARQFSGTASQRLIGLMTTSFALGQMIGPTLAGVLFDSLGSLRLPSLLAAMALFLSAGLAITVDRSIAR